MSKLSPFGLIALFLLIFLSFFVYNSLFFNLFGSSTVNNPTQSDNNFTHSVEDDFHQTKIFNSNDRLILMVIDAMRYDFVYEQNDARRSVRMPFLHQLMRSNNLIPFKLTAKSPTVTLPRLKALVSGIHPEFIDILWNFNTTRLNNDNLLRQLRQNNKSIVFYGDDTWLKLFPDDYFLRHEGTTSFIASDYDEVDFNVTRHLDAELDRSDWDVMILHYLGLDHVGHIEGPFAPLNIRRKLSEMDDVVRKLYSKLTPDDLMLVLSDHGMANEGGHGGSSHMELLTPAMFIFKNAPIHQIHDGVHFDSVKTHDQIDLVSTLSCLRNVRVPLENRGVTFVNDLVDFFKHTANPHQYKVLLTNARKCLRENFHQLNRRFNLTNFRPNLIDDDDEYRQLDDVNYNHRLERMNRRFESELKNAMNEVKSDENTGEQNFYLCLSILSILTFYLIIVGSLTSSPANLIKDFKSFDLLQKFYIFASVMYLLSLFSSSFIEEEHQIWYFLEVTQTYLILYQYAARRGRDDKSTLVEVLLLLVTIRLLRSINQTGDKWIHLKDIGDFFKENASKLPMMIVTGVCLIFTAKIYNFACFLCVNLSLIYVFHSSTNLELLKLYDRNLLAQLCYLLIFIQTVVELAKIKTNRMNGEQKCGHFFRALSIGWLQLNCLIQPTHNLMVVFMWALKTSLLTGRRREYFAKGTSQDVFIYFYYVVTNAAYFTLGNSNSLNTIPIQSGFVGINRLNEPLVALLLVASTFSSTVYWFLLQAENLTHQVADCKKSDKSIKNNQTRILVEKYILIETTIVVVYTMSSYLQKEHLFVWSVFAPKLIYLLIGTGVKFTLLLLYSIVVRCFFDT